MESIEELLENDDVKLFRNFMNKGEAPYNYEKQLLRQHFKRVALILKGNLVPPYELEIQPTSKCNLRCDHCFGKACKRIPDKLGKKGMEEIARKVEDFRYDDLKIDNIKFCGITGEPLVNSATMYGIEIFKNIGKKVFLFSNGLWLDKEVDGKSYIDYILEADRLILSLDAGSPETFKRLKKVDGFDRIVKSLDELLKRRNGSNPNVVVSYVIGSKNYNDIVQATELARKIGADEIRFRVDFTDKQKIHELSDIIIDNIHQAKELNDDNFKVISMYSEKGVRKDDSEFASYGVNCFIHNLWACIGPNGELYSCGHRTKAEVESFGSILEKSFQELWYSNKRRECVKDLPDKHCEYCSPYSVRINEFGTQLCKFKLKHKIFPEDI
ncbi:radical SAM protein [Candidatus Woesearchaeota archaeon]|nr:radical SAM protein [Candidatus Woesearchaeota archaeon]